MAYDNPAFLASIPQASPIGPAPIIRRSTVLLTCKCQFENYIFSLSNPISARFSRHFSRLGKVSFNGRAGPFTFDASLSHGNQEKDIDHNRDCNRDHYWISVRSRGL